MTNQPKHQVGRINTLLTQNRTLVDVLNYRAEVTPQSLAFHFLDERNLDNNTLSYQALNEQAKSVAVYLRQQGLKQGDRVLLILKPGLPLIEAFFGCLFAGVIAIPVYPPTNTQYTKKILSIIENAQPAVIFSDSAINQAYLQALFEGFPILEYQSLDKHLAQDWRRPEINADTVAFLQYTSGSTSEPKGVIIRHGNLLDNLSIVHEYFDISEQSIILGWLPPYHDMGLIGKILQPVFAGAPGYLMTPFSFLKNPYAWLKSLTTYRATISGAPNFAYDYCVRRIKESKKASLDLSSWRVAFNGAEPIRQETMEKFYHAFKDVGFSQKAFLPCYGLAESTLFVTGARAGSGSKTIKVDEAAFLRHKVQLASNEKESKLLVSSGEIKLPIRVVDEQTLKECPADTIGEIWVAGQSVASGYWHSDEESQKTFAQELVDCDKDKLVYLRTGDLGFIHDGHLYVTGRIKDLLILYGKNHYPQDIEHTVIQSCPTKFIQNCAAFTSHTAKNTELIVVLETLKTLSEQEYEQMAKNIYQNIFEEHQLKADKIVLVPTKSLPLTTSGKIRRRLISEQFSQGELQVLYQWATEA